MMKKFFYLVAIVFLIDACSRVPVTGRRQLNMLPESTMRSMAITNYKAFLSKSAVVSTSEENAQLVKQVGQKISHAVERYLKSKGLSKRIKDYKWEFNLVNDKTVNAWCMPGGKVVVYTGLLPVAQNEEGLAVVMGHEIAHAIARHGNERMSQQLLVATGGLALSVALSQKPQLTHDVFLQSYGVASTLGVLKYSRTHETEADKMGLVFMAMAGYDPNSAVSFWERMSKEGGANVPEIISTHPSDERRIKDIKSFIPYAQKYYTGSK